MAPPHPRGSTRGAAGCGRCRRGSPAPAGIDPDWSSRRACWRRLPRTRGDRPCRWLTNWTPVSAPPHPRGSTQGGAAIGHPSAGSPAPAGIDPDAGDTHTHLIRLPRIRGDRPLNGAPGFSGAPAPPHPRGSTRSCADPPGRRRGSPASAGIDPLATGAPDPIHWLPRIRGDRPNIETVLIEPLQAPPHPRGSTRLKSAREAAGFGSPASAGIDPSSMLAGWSAGRLPRIRGDRPYFRARNAIRDLAPPHPRGSTPTSTRVSTQIAGSPASAGIDPIAHRVR